MAINYKDALDKRDEFSSYLYNQIVTWIDAEADPDAVLKLTEVLLKEGWVEIND